jgi:hypothetical protein
MGLDSDDKLVKATGDYLQELQVVLLELLWLLQPVKYLTSWQSRTKFLDAIVASSAECG